MIAVINYGAGNLPNVVRALQRVGASLTVTDDPNVIRSAQAVVLPGVGATADTMASLRHLGIAEVLPTIITAGTPFLGICVGMQVLLSESEEFGPHSCLNIIQGTVRRLPESAGKIPRSVGIKFISHRLFVTTLSSMVFPTALMSTLCIRTTVPLPTSRWLLHAPIMASLSPVSLFAIGWQPFSSIQKKWRLWLTPASQFCALERSF